MNTDLDVSSHYSRGHLRDRLYAGLSEDGIDPGHLSIEALAPYDQFHGRGLEATVEIADQLPVKASDHLLDIGSGLGGPARYFAHRFGCQVTGVELTAEFFDVARDLTRALSFEKRVTFELGNALAMPFANDCFDGAYSMNVSMNIADKGAFYREIHRVLKPGAWLLLSEISKSAGGDPDYPTPWANSAHTSFLSTPEETRSGLVEAGFDVARLYSTLDRALSFGARSRAMVERGEKPPNRAVQLIHGAMAAQIMANMARGLAESRIVPIEVLATKRR